MSITQRPVSTQPAPAAPLVLELSVDERPYRIVLPHAGTDYIQKKLATDRTPYEQEMLEDIRSRVARGGLVLDIGANIGNHTLFLAAVAGCRVESFEPNPQLCAALRESIELNGLVGQVQLHETGLGRSAGMARFGVDTPENLGGQHLALGEGELKVSMLDSFSFGQRVDVIKLDVEGMEIDVLEGGRSLLERDRPLVYVECGTEAHYRRMSRWMAALNYTYWDTFNATPTHLFIPAERLSVEQRLQHLQAKSAQNDYKSNQLLREIRLRMSQAQEKEREARAALSAAQAKEQEARLSLTNAQTREREIESALQAAQRGERDAHERLSTLASQLQATEQRLAEEQRRLREQTDDLQARLSAAQVSHAAVQAELTLAQKAVADVQKLEERAKTLQRALDQSKLATQKLTRTVEVREVRLAATERREAALTERLERTRETAAFQVGQALVAAGRSVGGAVRLPMRLLRIYRDVRRRRERRASQAEGNAPASLAPPSPSMRRSVSSARAAVAKGAAPGAAARVTLPEATPEPATLPRLPETLKGLRVAAIMDEFTHHSFASECELRPLRIAEWRSQVDEFRPDLVFIESAWRGAEGDWSLKISNPSEELAALIAWAQAQRVPTVFWNKEDPVHFGGFLHVARSVDYVFTTDIDCIARYKREVGHDRVYLLPFAAQPASHNPIERFPRDDAFCFAGSYYLKYPERQRDFRSLLDVVKELKPVEIFDRNFGKAHPHYEFPPEYQPYIVGSLPFDQIDKAYKGYRYGINMNTIKQSQTMFARRVFELLASNTVVVSNFSRGMRLMFGDLVVSSDASSEIRRRLATLSDDVTLRKFRLAGLRKVMAQHTYAHRLAYIAEKLGGPGLAAQPATLCAVAFPRNADEARALAVDWQHQSLEGVTLALVGPVVPVDLLGERIQHVRDVAALGALPAYAGADWIAPLSVADYHGPNYLLDLHQATSYCEAQAIGKAAHFRATADGVALVDGELAYRSTERLPVRAGVLKRARFQALDIRDADTLDAATLEGEGLIAIDEFNYAMGTGCAPAAAIRQAVDDLPGLRVGLDATRELLPRAERIAAATQPDAGTDAASTPGLSAEQLAELLPGNSGATLADGELKLDVAVPEGKHRYVYLDRVFTRAELNLEMNSRFQLLCTHAESLEVRTVFEFLDEKQQKVGHAMNKAGEAFSLPIPARCSFMRVGLRIVGHGTLRIAKLVLADLRERPTVLVGTAHKLVLLKQYPSYDDLYKYGFVHSRVRAYARARMLTDVFRFSPDEPCSFREFEDVDVIHGDRDLLDLALSSGSCDHVLVHLMDRQMWEVLQRHIDRVRVTVWMHGAEVQSWQRRAFEFERMDEAEVERQKKLSEQRVTFWQEVLAHPHPNLDLVFVSKHFAGEVAEDLGLDLSTVRHSIIHNFVDAELFPYRAKSPEQRFNLLAIRPFVSRKYANDLLIAGILELARRPGFERYRITIVGDGEEFESARAALGTYANVEMIQRFVTQREIGELHMRHGIFLSPTRWDSQGVSRDEAMSSGLVPISHAVAAVHEFMDNQCGVLVPAEAVAAMADAISGLADDPQRFLRLSAAASARVGHQAGFEATIRRELALLSPAGYGDTSSRH
ncbi:FkbM family methyltransferase [Caldimonas sp. KR1-144]|uniref:FkbM family methyltransferase n=1 Tax=Caldimonas sp. KR1-144 TaxID=3400911 RepID=UPI003C0E04F8